MACQESPRPGIVTKAGELQIPQQVSRRARPDRTKHPPATDIRYKDGLWMFDDDSCSARIRRNHCHTREILPTSWGSSYVGIVFWPCGLMVASCLHPRLGLTFLIFVVFPASLTITAPFLLTVMEGKPSSCLRLRVDFLFFRIEMFFTLRGAIAVHEL